MIATDKQARQLVCPLISSGQGKRIRCVGTECAWWRWHSPPGVNAEEYSVHTSEPVGGCGALGAASSQHWLVAMNRQRPRTAQTFGKPFDVDRLNQSAETSDTARDVF